MTRPRARRELSPLIGGLLVLLLFFAAGAVEGQCSLPIRLLEVESINVSPAGAAVVLQVYEPTALGPVAVTGPGAVYPVWISILVHDGQAGRVPDEVHVVTGGYHWSSQAVAWTGVDGRLTVTVADEAGSSALVVHLLAVLANPQSPGVGPRATATPLALSFDLAGSAG